MDNGTLYLSGSMQHAPDGALGAGWRATCSETLADMGFRSLDIAEMDKLYSATHTNTMRCTLSNLESEAKRIQAKSDIRKHYIKADLDLIKYQADAMIIYYDSGVRKGAGTISECQFAFDHDIPIFLINSYANDEEVPGWLYGLTTKMFDDFESLYAYLAELPPGILKRDCYGNRRSGNHYLCSLCGTVEEKHGAHFVSEVRPLYCKACVDVVKETYETNKDRYEFFVEYLAAQQSN